MCVCRSLSGALACGHDRRCVDLQQSKSTRDAPMGRRLSTEGGDLLVCSCTECIYGYLEVNMGTEVLWPETALEGMTEDQRAVMLPPYHSQINRPYLDGEEIVMKEKARVPFKVEFDKKVFGTRCI